MKRRLFLASLAATAISTHATAGDEKLALAVLAIDGMR